METHSCIFQKSLTYEAYDVQKFLPIPAGGEKKARGPGVFRNIEGRGGLAKSTPRNTPVWTLSGKGAPGSALPSPVAAPLQLPSAANLFGSHSHHFLCQAGPTAEKPCFLLLEKLPDTLQSGRK